MHKSERNLPITTFPEQYSSGERERRPAIDFITKLFPTCAGGNIGLRLRGWELGWLNIMVQVVTLRVHRTKKKKAQPLRAYNKYSN